MRLLIIGSLGGQIGAASQIAISRGAKVMQVDNVEGALRLLRSGEGADLLMIDVQEDIDSLAKSLQSERITVAVVACGVGSDTQAAVRAIKAGAKEYIPLPPSADLIAAVLTAVTEESHAIIHRDPQMAEVLQLANQIAPSDASVRANRMYACAVRTETLVCSLIQASQPPCRTCSLTWISSRPAASAWRMEA